MIGSGFNTLSPVTGWENLTGSGIEDTTNTNSRTTDCVAFNSKIYIAWAGLTLPSVGRIYVSSYDPSNGTFTRVDAGSALGINNDAAHFAQTPSLCVFNSKLYAAWQEDLPFIRCKVYNGNDTSPSWAAVHVSATQGLNKASNRPAFCPRLIEFNSKLYCMWQEEASSGGNRDTQIRCKVYNGDDSSPAWTFVDGNAGTGLNKSVTEPAYSACPVVFDSKLYAFWAENNPSGIRQLRCKVYNGNDSSPSWSFVDGNGTNGLNFNTAHEASTNLITELRGASGFVFNSKLYVLFNEGANDSPGIDHNPRLLVYNGNDSSPSWTFVDGNGTDGFIFDTTKGCNNVDVIVVPGWNPHFFWCESVGTTQASVYNGEDSSPRRVSVDTSDTFSAFSTVNARYAFHETLYVAFCTGGNVTLYRATL